jgi:SAM-dependent methyltransferase
MSGSRARPSDAAEVAEEVRAFYERHPYPPPVDDLDRYRRSWNDPKKRRADSHLFWPAEPCREDRSILVAGCGTFQAAKHALRWPQARVTGIDVSQTSIRSTEELKRKHHLENLEVHLLPLERAADLGRTFKQVVCTGVLHHLPDPDAGLRALRGVMEPDSALHFMVYAPFGRAGIYLLQEYCRRLGIGTSTQEIQELAASLRALPPDHPLVPLLRNAPDFSDEAALADALLNPQDRPYSVPQLFDLMGGAGLRFGRWVRQAPYLPQCGAIASSPHRPRLAGLPAKEQYAALELFRGTMVRHSAILYRDDAPGTAQPIRFDGNGWTDYVPHRLPGTLSVQERLPPGAAAVLINPSHTYTDIYLPIAAAEKPLFDAIDGVRSIGEIAREHGRLDSARAFFERLWWYDQVVFDASRCEDSQREGRESGTETLIDRNGGSNVR